MHCSCPLPPLQMAYLRPLAVSLISNVAASWTQLDGIWHTSIVVGGQEIYYGGGIQTAVPGTTPHGQPVQVRPLQTLRASCCRCAHLR